MILSKYTEQVNHICEMYAGVEIGGFSNVEDILEKSWDKIFTNNWNIFDESYRKILCKKILRTYYTREICAETIGLWKLWLDATMCEIMPKYNQLYESETYKFNPLYNVDITTTFEKKVNETSKNEDSRTGKINGNSDSTSNVSRQNESTTNGNNTQKYSDTPQGGLKGLTEDEYLTNATINNSQNVISESDSSNGSTKTSNSSNNQENGSSSGSKENIENWIQKVQGKNSGENYATIIKDFRENILNIDKMIIDELKPLFFNLW